MAKAQANPAQVNVDDALKFVLSGQVTFTLVSKKKGNRYTYKVEQPAPKKEGDKPTKIWFVKLLTGPQNTTDYTYLGAIKLDNETPYFSLTNASKYEESSAPVQAFGWTFSRIKAKLDPFVEIWYEGRCALCGRPLTVPESIARGMGPECADNAAY